MNEFKSVEDAIKFLEEETTRLEAESKKETIDQLHAIIEKRDELIYKYETLVRNIDCMTGNFNGSWENLSDRYHTFRELYMQRALLLAAWMNATKDEIDAWKSKKHFNEAEFPMFRGMFIVGGTLRRGGDFTFHVDGKYWEYFYIPELEHAKEYDGHTPDDVLDRIRTYLWYEKPI